MKNKVEKKYALVHATNDARRVRMVKEIFSTIPGRYDFLNHLLSAGQDIHWRRCAARSLRFFETYRFLDVAAGTGDLSLATLVRHPGVCSVGIDFVREMLQPAQSKIRRQHTVHRFKLIQADALSLPFREERFDAAGIAFGIRNIPDKIQALKEMTRVVVPGGQILVLEMTLPQGPFAKRFYSVYLMRVLPVLAGIFSSNPDAYTYLGDSITDFPSPGEFSRLMENCGLSDVRARSLTLGITHMFIGRKPGKHFRNRSGASTLARRENGARSCPIPGKR